MCVRVIVISFFLFIGCMVLSGNISGQGYIGVVKNEQGGIMVSSNGFSSLISLADAWNVSQEIITNANPGIDPGSFSGTMDIMIPLNNLLKAEPCEGCSPVYHRVQQGEGLFRIGRWYGNIPVSALKERNTLRSDALKPGQQLLIGYVKVPSATFVDHDKKAPENIQANPSGNDLKEEKPKVEDTPILTKPSESLIYSGNGIFETEYLNSNPSGAKKAGKAATFKSESGWKDGRFYILCNQLKTGVVVRLMHADSGKVIYAKVVGPLPNIKQNEGLDWRINTAAAAALGMVNENEAFPLEIQY